MIIIVDAYNVLKQVQQKLISERERCAFINLLKKYGRNKGHQVVVVFDGGPCTWPSKEVVGCVTVVYSGAQMSADDYIRRYIKEHCNKELLLVTNDRELRKNGMRYEVDAIDSLDFYRNINSEYAAPKEKVVDARLIKLTENVVEEVDILMQELGKMPPKKEEEKVTRHIKSGFTPSKKERKIIKKIKKL